MLRPLNQGLISVGSGTKFEDFVESVYKSTVLPVMAKTTQDRYVSVLKNYLVPAFGESSLRDVTPIVVQRYLSKMAGSALSHESRDKIRDVLSSVLGSAVQFNLLVKNPVEGLKLPPPSKGRRSKPYITPKQFQALMALISEPYATMVFVAVYTGFRVSEVVGSRWRNVHEDSITIDERYTRGDWGAPKSNASNGVLLGDLLEHAGFDFRECQERTLKSYAAIEPVEDAHVLFALAELDTTLTEKRILLADSKNGKPMSPPEGPYRIIVFDEKQPARWVRQVWTIFVAEMFSRAGAPGCERAEGHLLLADPKSKVSSTASIQHHRQSPLKG